MAQPRTGGSSLLGRRAVLSRYVFRASMMRQGPVQGKNGMGGKLQTWHQKTDIQQLFIQACTNFDYMPMQCWALSRPKDADPLSL